MWFPIHFHELPRGLWTMPLAGAVFCIEHRPEHLRAMGMSATTPAEFIDEWPRLVRNTPLAGVDRIRFTTEGELDLGTPTDVRALMAKGLAMMQLYHWQLPNRYLTPDGLTADGRELLTLAEGEDLIIDLSHLHGDLLSMVLDAYDGRRVVSHVVCRRLLDDEGQRSNAMTEAELTACEAELLGVPFIDDLLSPTPAFLPEDRNATIDTIVDQIVGLSEFGPVALAPDFFRQIAIRGTGIETANVIDDDAGLLKLADALTVKGVDAENVFWRNARVVF